MIFENKHYKKISVILILLLSLANIFQLVSNTRNSENNGIFKGDNTSERQTDSLQNALNILTAKSKVDDLLLNMLIHQEEYPADTLEKLLCQDIFITQEAYRTKRILAENYIKSGREIQHNSKKKGTESSVEAIERKYREHLHMMSDEKNLLANQVKYFTDSIRRYSDSLHSVQLSMNNINQQHEASLSVIEFRRNGYTINYAGEKQNSMANGYGVGIWSTGGLYKGEWKDNLRAGKGTYKWKDGDIYEGQWQDDMRTGEGKYIWKDGQFYIGGWLNNKREGFGTVFYANGKVQYEGQWKGDKFIQPKKAKQ